MVARARYNAGRFLRFLLFVCLAAGMMIADHNSPYLQGLRSGLAALALPVQFVATLPELTASAVDSWLKSEESVREVYAKLREDHTKLRAQLQRLQALESENVSLRKLLAASEKVPDQVLMAELIEVSLDPYTHKILLNRGLIDGVHVGQPVLDPDGIMGQVTQAMPLTSAVTLITDPSHGLPVHVRRNGLRAIAFGTGHADELRVSYLTPNADIQVDDILVTSGLGGRFPAGYPVAKVTELVSDASEAFLRISARPIAQLDRTNHVLLLWHGLEKPASEPAHMQLAH